MRIVSFLLALAATGLVPQLSLAQSQDAQQPQSQTPAPSPTASPAVTQPQNQNQTASAAATSNVMVNGSMVAPSATQSVSASASATASSLSTPGIEDTGVTCFIPIVNGSFHGFDINCTMVDLYGLHDVPVNCTIPVIENGNVAGSLMNCSLPYFNVTTLHNGTTLVNNTVFSNETHGDLTGYNATIVNGTDQPANWTAPLFNHTVPLGMHNCSISSVISINGTNVTGTMTVNGTCPLTVLLPPVTPPYDLPNYNTTYMLITSPDSKAGWVAGTAGQVQWKWNSTENPQLKVFIARVSDAQDAGIASILVNGQQGTTTLPLGAFAKIGKDFMVRAVDDANTSLVYATSEQFEIKPAGSKPGSSGMRSAAVGDAVAAAAFLGAAVFALL